MERVKFQGGPMHNKYQDVENAHSRLAVQGMTEQRRWSPMDYTSPYDHMPFKRGDYALSNKRLKNGTKIYIWMGWIE